MCCPLPAYTPAMGGGGLHRDDLIAEYFAQGFAYKDILVALLVSHGLSVSLKTLKRTLRRLGLRRKQPLCRDQLIAAIEQMKSLFAKNRYLVFRKKIFSNFQKFSRQIVRVDLNKFNII